MQFLKGYRGSNILWYDYILTEDQSTHAMFNGHELEKIKICKELGKVAEAAIWNMQSHSFWNGEIKQLITWSKNETGFSLDNFIRICQCFDLLFDQKQNSGWTSDNVRQALITCLPQYPLDGCYFGYASEQWKQIMRNNSDNFRRFLKMFDGVDKQSRDEKIDEMKRCYLEIPGNKWAEFVQHDYLLQYCNTKRIQYRDEYGIECVQNCYKQPFSVKNMHLDDYLKNHLKDCVSFSDGWNYCVDKGGWKSVIRIYNSKFPFEIHIQYRKDCDKQYEIALIAQSNPFSNVEKITIEAAGFTHKEDRFVAYVSENMDSLMDAIGKVVAFYRESKAES